MKSIKKIFLIMMAAFFAFSPIVLNGCSANLLAEITETNEKTDIRIETTDPTGIHVQLRPSEIKVGDPYQSFAHLTLEKNLLDGCVLLNSNSDTGEKSYTFVPYGYFGFDYEKFDFSSIVPDYKDRPTKLCQVEAPEGSYYIYMSAPVNSFEDLENEECYVLGITLIPRPNRLYTTNAAEFPLSEVVIGDSFEKLLLFNPIPVKTGESETNRIQYKMFVESGEYVYTLERETQTAEFYITNIEFIEAT